MVRVAIALVAVPLAIDATVGNPRLRAQTEDPGPYALRLLPSG